MQKMELSINKSKHELAVTNPANLLLNSAIPVKYEMVDASHYAFNYSIDDNINVAMYESDFDCTNNEFIDAEYVESISEYDKSYYLIAAVSGLLTGLISLFDFDKDKIEKINEWKNNDWNKLIVAAAKLAGYKKNDEKGAIRFLLSHVISIDDNVLESACAQTSSKCFEYLSSHPSIAGLIFSILTQFSGKRFSFADEELEESALPEYFAIGENLLEKITFGFLYWVFNLAVNAVYAKRNVLDNLGIPKELVKVIKDLCNSSPFRNIPKDYYEAEQKISEWIEKIFHNSVYIDDDGEEKQFNLQEVMETTSNRIMSDSFPVILNECFVRGFYIIKCLSGVIKEQKIASIEALKDIDVVKILPFNNRVISKMVLIASGSFVGVNATGAVVKTILNKQANGKKFARTLYAEINIDGIGRFIFACIADAKYWSDDFKIIMERKKRKKSKETIEENVEVDPTEAFDMLSLDSIQARVLYSLEAFAVRSDIDHTEKAETKKDKELWLDIWENSIASGIGVPKEEYFVSDENLLYEGLAEMIREGDNRRWFYLLTMELALFTPYFALGCDEDVNFKKMKASDYDYVRDVFVRKQTIVSQDEVDEILKEYKKNKGIISGSSQNLIISASVATAVAIASGGLAFAFAPGIAVAIAGEAVAGLHGAALTGASLAFVGGGSLAAGGLGMAGGTAIITGGGAILGLVSTSGASLAAIMSQTSIEYWLRQCTKMVTFSKCVLHGIIHDKNDVITIQHGLEKLHENVIEEIGVLEEEKNDLDKEELKKLKECEKYIDRSIAELKKVKAVD